MILHSGYGLIALNAIVFIEMYDSCSFKTQIMSTNLCDLWNSILFYYRILLNNIIFLSKQASANVIADL